MTNKEKLEDVLRDIHAEDYMGADDDMSDSFEAWLEELTMADIYKFLE